MREPERRPPSTIVSAALLYIRVRSQKSVSLLGTRGGSLDPIYSAGGS